MNYSHLTRSELYSLLEKHKLALLNIKCSPTRPDEATIAEAQKDIDDMLTALNLATTTSSHSHTDTPHGLLMRLQSLRDAMRDIKSLNPGNDVHRFITDLNQAYTINVKPDLAKYPDMEDEFMKIAKRLLDRGIFQQMEDSQQIISGFEQLKSYLMETHGNQMSNFQHLSRAWDLQRGNGERLTDFAGRLENTMREATVHIRNKFKKDNTKELTVDSVVSLVGAMLMSEKIKAWTPNIYPHLVKTMDNHYTAGGIASEAQRYLDRGIKTDDTTEHNATAYYNKPQQPMQHKDTSGQRFKANKQQPQWRPQITKYTPLRNISTSNQTHRDKARSQAICRNYSRGLNCFHGRNCPYRHPPLAQAHVAATEEEISTSDTSSPINDPDFPYGPKEK